MTRHEKGFIHLRGWLLGHYFYNAYRALEFARQHHTGKRKDLITPEFSHQVTTTLFVTTFEKNLLFPEDSIACMALHDVVEDHGVSIEEIRRLFGDRIAEAVYAISKVINGQRRSDEEYYGNMAASAIASVDKGFDRIHNQNTMLEVFNYEKQLQYINETESHIIPMLKIARNLHPEQQPVYLNIKLVLETQINLIKAVHVAMKRK